MTHTNVPHFLEGSLMLPLLWEIWRDPEAPLTISTYHLLSLRIAFLSLRASMNLLSAQVLPPEPRTSSPPPFWFIAVASYLIPLVDPLLVQPIWHSDFISTFSKPFMIRVGWLHGCEIWQLHQTPHLEGSILVQCSTIGILKMFMIFEPEVNIFILHWGSQIMYLNWSMFQFKMFQWLLTLGVFPSLFSAWHTKNIVIYVCYSGLLEAPAPGQP